MPAENRSSTSNRRLAAILFADIVGYTAMMQSDERNTLNRLKHYQEVLKKNVGEYNGEIIKNYGDGSLCLFPSVLDAVHCAKGVQLVFQKEPKIPLRIGLHLGDVVYQENDVYGNALNISSRIESMGVSGSVLLSKSIFDRVKNQSDLQFQSVGRFEFKNVEEPMEVYALTNNGLLIPKASEFLGKGKKLSAERNSLNPWLISVVAAFSLVLLYLILNLNPSQSQNKSGILNGTISQDKSIAVLPLLNLNSKSENLEYFSDGVTQEIIDELSQIKALTMIAFTTTIRYKQTDKSNTSIAEELNAKYLISGTSRIYNSGDSVRISLELIDTKDDDKRLWSGTYNEIMDDAPNIQIKIAKQVANSLNIKLSTDERSQINQVNTTSGEAYRLFLLARSEFFKLSKEGFNRSIEILERVVAIDPYYAQAHTFQAWAYSLASNPWFDGHINKPIKELNEYISPIIEKSLELDPSNSDIFLVRGHQRAFIDGNLRDAKEDVDYALELNSWPLVPTTYCMCIVVSTYVALDDIEPAADLIELARKLDPGSVFIEWDAANVLMKKGEFKKAQELYADAAHTAPVSMFKTFLGWNYYHNAEYKKAGAQLLRTYNESELPITLNVAYLSNTYHKLGDLSKSDLYLNELISRDASGEHHVNLYIAIVHLARGEKLKALDYLEKALIKRNWGMALLINLDPIFKILYDEPRFVEIRKGVQYYE